MGIAGPGNARGIRLDREGDAVGAVPVTEELRRRRRPATVPAGAPRRAVRRAGSGKRLPGREVAGGRRITSVVRGGNCPEVTDVVKVSGSAGVFIQGSSCPTGGSVSFKGNRP
ncbi:hypothetical protein GCM10023237_57900 [Streptomyces coeruleoprunus]